MAHIFFSRCLKENVTPYVVTKKTVFKWQGEAFSLLVFFHVHLLFFSEPFWTAFKRVFDEHYKSRFAELGLLDSTGGELKVCAGLVVVGVLTSARST